VTVMNIDSDNIENLYSPILVDNSAITAN